MRAHQNRDSIQHWEMVQICGDDIKGADGSDSRQAARSNNLGAGYCTRAGGDSLIGCSNRSIIKQFPQCLY